MTKRMKVLLLVLGVGLCGLIITSAIIIGSGQLASREESRSYAVSESFDDVRIQKSAATVTFAAADDVRIDVYAKAWLDKPIDLDQLVAIQVLNGVLQITETPFPDVFLGIFPQPYELSITIYVPQTVYDEMEEYAP